MRRKGYGNLTKFPRIYLEKCVLRRFRGSFMHDFGKDGVNLYYFAKNLKEGEEPKDLP